MRRQTRGLGILGGPSAVGDALVDSYAIPGLSTRTGEGGGFDANMAAIVDYFNAQEPKTDAAGAIKNDFAKWYAGLGFMDRNWYMDDTYAKARNYRDSYNVANATTPQEAAAVVQFQKTGITSEQQYNEDAKARLTSGAYATAPKPPIPLGWQIAIGVVIGGSILLFAYGSGKALPGAVLGGGRKHAANGRSRRRRS